MSEKRISGWNSPVKAASLSDAKELYEKASSPIEEPKKKAKKAKAKPAKTKKPAAKNPVRTIAKKPVSKKKAK